MSLEQKLRHIVREECISIISEQNNINTQKIKKVKKAMIIAASAFAGINEKGIDDALSQLRKQVNIYISSFKKE